MPKRLTDGEKWNKAWHRSLSPLQKVFFDYLCDCCDLAGCLDVDVTRFAFDLGVSQSKVDGVWVGIKDVECSDGVICITDFIEFQYPRGLHPDKNNAHLGVLRVLTKRSAHNPNLYERHKSLLEEGAALGLVSLSVPLPRGTGIGTGLGTGLGIGLGLGKGLGKEMFAEDSDEVRLSLLLVELIKGRSATFKKYDVQTWASHVDKMLRIDGRTPEAVEAVIRWCQGDDFWCNNILSTSKLRKQYDQLELKRTGSNDGGAGKGGKGSRRFALADEQKGKFNGL